MTIKKESPQVCATEMGYDDDTRRFWTMVYILFPNGKEMYANVGCTDIIEYDTVDYTVEFLDVGSLNSIMIPYDLELFEEIEREALMVFVQMKDDERSNSG